MLLNTLLFLNLGAQEVVLVIFAVLLLFGGEKLPELARGLGKGIREFKDASDGVKREIHRNINQLTAQEELKRDEALNDSSDTQKSISEFNSDEDLVKSENIVKTVEKPIEVNNLNNQNQ